MKRRDIILLLALVMAACLLGGCACHRSVEAVELVRDSAAVARSRTEVAARAVELRDSVTVRDSQRVRMAGDTVWVERRSVVERVRTRRDTVWEAVVMSDTVWRDRVSERPVIVEKERSRTLWERVRLWPGWVLLVVGVAGWKVKGLIGRLRP